MLTLVRDRNDHLANLLRGLRRSSLPPAELIVARMEGEDPRPVLAERTSFPVEVIEVPGADLPLSRARNRAAGAARGEHLVFLDVDCVPGADLVAAFARALADEDWLALGPTLYLPPGPCPGDEQGLRLRARQHPARSGLFGDGVRVDRRHDLFWSLNFALRRSTFRDRLGGFDEGYRGYGIEDTDFGRRAAIAGVPVAWVGPAVAYHQHHPPTRWTAEAARSVVRNARRFQRRWGGWPAPGWLRELDELGLVRWDEEAETLEAVGDEAAAASRSR